MLTISIGFHHNGNSIGNINYGAVVDAASWFETILIVNCIRRYCGKNVVLDNKPFDDLDNIGVTDVGLRSATELIGMHLGTGVITAVRQAAGPTL